MESIIDLLCKSGGKAQLVFSGDLIYCKFDFRWSVAAEGVFLAGLTWKEIISICYLHIFQKLILKLWLLWHLKVPKKAKASDLLFLLFLNYFKWSGFDCVIFPIHENSQPKCCGRELTLLTHKPYLLVQLNGRNQETLSARAQITRKDVMSDLLAPFMCCLIL